MLKWMLRRWIDGFGRKWNYDTGYMRDVLDEGGAGAVIPLAALGALNYQKDVPAPVYAASTLTAAIAADCGPCAQLGVSMAEKAGVPAPTLRAIIRGDRAALSEEERLGYDLARATLERAPAIEVREEILRRWGMRALVSLAYGMVAAQSYPTFKYAIGHGHACTRLSVAGKDVQRVLNVVA
jgi:hypothetical protein